MAAYEIPGFSFTLPSGADFTGEAAGQHRFVLRNSSGAAVNPSAGGPATGVRSNKPNTGQATTVCSTGIVWVEAAEAITVGQNVGTDATGKAVVAGTTGETILGQAATAAVGNGSIVSVQLQTSNVLAL